MFHHSSSLVLWSLSLVSENSDEEQKSPLLLSISTQPFPLLGALRSEEKELHGFCNPERQGKDKVHGPACRSLCQRPSLWASGSPCLACSGLLCDCDLFQELLLDKSPSVSFLSFYGRKTFKLMWHSSVYLTVWYKETSLGTVLCPSMVSQEATLLPSWQNLAKV